MYVKVAWHITIENYARQHALQYQNANVVTCTSISKCKCSHLHSNPPIDVSVTYSRSHPPPPPPPRSRRMPLHCVAMCTTAGAAANTCPPPTLSSQPTPGKPSAVPSVFTSRDTQLDVILDVILYQHNSLDPSVLVCVAGWLVTAAAVASWTTRQGQGRTTRCTAPCSGPYASPRRDTRMTHTSFSSCRYKKLNS